MDRYRSAICEGLLIAMGGLSKSLVFSVHSRRNDLRPAKADDAFLALSTYATEFLVNRRSIEAAVLEVLRARRLVERVTTPVLRSLQRLYETAVLPSGASTGAACAEDIGFREALLPLLKEEV